jgi:hypothetical protein
MNEGAVGLPAAPSHGTLTSTLGTVE